MTPTPLWRRYSRLFGPDPAADVKDELRFHLEAKIDDLVAHGWRPEDAREEAERQFGDLRTVQQIGMHIGANMERRKRLKDYWSDTVTRRALYVPHARPRSGICCRLHPHPGSCHRSEHRGLQRGQHVCCCDLLPFPDSRQLVWIAPPPNELRPLVRDLLRRRDTKNSVRRAASIRM